MAAAKKTARKSTRKLPTEVASGDRRRALEALRDRLAKELEHEAEAGFCLECKRSSSSVAPLAKQLRDTMAELAALPVAREGTVLDELAKRRAGGPAKADTGS